MYEVLYTDIPNLRARKVFTDLTSAKQFAAKRKAFIYRIGENKTELVANYLVRSN